ncbi:MAG: hypothetical protein WBQ25_07775 [Nitrososphaeraceae archaeon]
MSGSSKNMTSVMTDLARIHLKAADKALMNGNTPGALTQLNLAQLQLAMMNMKAMDTMNEQQAMQFMKGGGAAGGLMFSEIPDICVIAGGGTFHCLYHQR